MQKFMKNLKIRHALIGIIAIALLTLATITTIINNQLFIGVTEKSIQTDLLPNQLEKVEARIRYQLSTPLELSKAITQNKLLVDWSLAGEPDSFQPDVIEFLKYMQQKNNALVVFWVSNVSKNYLNQGGVLKKLDPSADSWFFDFLASGKAYEIAFDYEEGTQALTAFVNYRVTEGGKDLAVAGLGYKVSQISEDILTNKVGETGFVFVTNSEGEVIIHPELAELEQRQLKAIDGFNEAADSLLQTDPSYVFEQVVSDGEAYYVASMGIPELGWKIIAMLPVAEPMSSINKALTTTAVVTLGMAILFLLVMVGVSNRITKPIVDIGERLSEMAQRGGDLTQKLDDQRGDEIGDLAKGFNAIIGKVREIMVDIKSTENVMSHSFDDLQSVSDEVNACTESQRLEADSVATAATQMSHSIAEVSELATNTANKTDTTEVQLNESNAEVRQSSEMMNQLHVSNEETEASIRQLAEQSQTINSVVDTISGISEQTNLLALNAAIEAARAGEMGRGFAVVADEVRSLAARTQDSTTEIKTVIESLQTQSEKAVLSMKENTELVDDGLTKMTSASEKLGDAVGDIHEITNMNTQVATATQEQTSVISELSTNVIRIADMAETVSELTQRTKSNIENLDDQRKSLAALVSQFKTD